MKNIKLIALLMVFALSVQAQQGSWYVGGFAGFGTESESFDKNLNSTSWSFAPEVGTFFNEKWSAGIALGLNGASSKDDDGDVESSSMFAPDIYVRRWMPAGEKLNFFCGLDVAFGMGSNTDYKKDETVDISSFGTNVNAGVAYALASRWTLLFKVSTLGFESNTKGDNTTTNFGLVADGNITNNQFIFVGLYWTFLPSK